MDTLTHHHMHCCFSNFFWILLLAVFVTTDAAHAAELSNGPPRANKDLDQISRFNGCRWFYFDMATIASCQSAAVIEELPDLSEYKVYVAENHDSLERIKEWVSENFARYLNFSPNDPKYFAEIPVKKLVLYSSPAIPISVLKAPSNLRTEEENIEVHKQTLLTIPMDHPTLFGNDNSKLSSTYEKLRSWVSANNQAKRDPWKASIGKPFTIVGSYEIHGRFGPFITSNIPGEEYKQVYIVGKRRKADSAALQDGEIVRASGELKFSEKCWDGNTSHASSRAYFYFEGEKVELSLEEQH